MVDQALIHALFAFIASVGIHVSDEDVVVTYESSQRIERLYKQPAVAICLHGHVMLGPMVDLKTELGRSTLVHELVHYTQDKCPRAKANVLAKREAIAYEIQNKYLESIGSKSRVPNPFYMDLFTPALRAEDVLPFRPVQRKDDSFSERAE